ncbi:hypothetical protein GGQ84_000796 [Desulfitispora alkaliphila]|uniref:PDZ domain-containing protein n=1 Tax=Desulfitispora alkaliphila TaxID=622674 RepID=UPI003D251299
MTLDTVVQLANLIMLNFVTIIFSPFFWLIAFVVYMQYKRINSQKENMFGIKGDKAWPHVMVATVHGIIGGLIGSFIIVALGISLSGIGIQYIWMLAIALMLISPRFLCFAYAGGIISLSYLLFGWPQVEIPQLIGLVATLHMVESVLIAVSGHLGAQPIYTKLDDDRIVGGFTLQKFWPIPLVALFIMTAPNITETANGIAMPDWWPLIKSTAIDNVDNFTYAMFPVVAALGYGDLALTSSPKEKSKKSAIYLGIYSLILLGLAILASYYPMLAVVAALFSPLGHELVIKFGRDVEFKGEPKYVMPKQGVMVLEKAYDSPADRAGLKTGDTILAVNGFPVNQKAELSEVLYWGGTALEIEYIENVTGTFKRELVRKKYREDLGVILVPEENEIYYAELSNKGLLRHWWDNVRKKD